MAAKRIYSDKEISSVLKRASELQRTKGPGSMAGLTLEELEQVAVEVGLDPGLVRKATQELEEEQPWERFYLLGAPTSIDRERIVDGEMTEEKWDEAAAEFRRVFGANGESGQVGRTREWTHAYGEDEHVHVTLSPVEQQTRIRVLQRMWVWAVSLHVPLMGLSIAPIAVQYALLDYGPVAETGIAVAIVAAFHGIARATYGAVVRKHDRKVRALFDFLDDLIGRSEAAAGEPVVQTAALAADEDAENARKRAASQQALAKASGQQR